jgi:hypothetical protein
MQIKSYNKMAENMQCYDRKSTYFFERHCWSTVFEELSMLIVDLMVANIRFNENCICDRQIHNWYLQLCKYSMVS